MSVCILVSANVAFCPEQCALPTEPVAEDGGLHAVRQGLGAPPTGDLHTRGHESVYHVTAGVCGYSYKVSHRHFQIANFSQYLCGLWINCIPSPNLYLSYVDVSFMVKKLKTHHGAIVRDRFTTYKTLTAHGMISQYVQIWKLDN